jgi:hypothetical protein
MSAYKISRTHVDSCIHHRSWKLPPSPYSKTVPKKIMTQIKLVCLSAIFHCTKFRLSECKGSWVVAIKQNADFKMQPSAILVLFPEEWSNQKLLILWKSNNMQNFMASRWLTKVLHPPQKFKRPPFWNSWNYGIGNYGFEFIFNGMTSLQNFINIYQLVQVLVEGQTHRQDGDLISLHFFFPFEGK